MDAEILDIGNRNMILGLCWLIENGFLVDTQDRWLKNVNSGQVITYFVRQIPEVLIVGVDPVEHGGILLIIDTNER